MLKRPYGEQQHNLMYQQTADSDFHLFLKREPYLLETPHYHDSLEFTYIERAETVVHVASEKQILSAGDISFANSYQIHNYEYYHPDLSAICVVLSKEYTAAFKKICGTNTLPTFMLDKEKNKEAGALLSEWIEHGSQSFLLNCAYANRFFDILMKAYELQPKDASVSNEMAISFLNYVNENFMHPISLKSLAQAFGYSESRCSYLFNSYVGVPFKNYLNEVRMQHALRMIESGKYSTAQVIEQSGFGSSVTFYRQYAKYKEKLAERHEFSNIC